MNSSSRIRTRPRFLSLALPLLAALAAAGPAAAEGCFAVVVGREASADGSVIFGHNEDDGMPCVVRQWWVPRRQHAEGDTVALKCGTVLPQAAETWGTLWSQMPGLDYSDTYLNEWGVGLASDNCPSRLPGEQTGIGFLLRRLVAQRARTAREGVELAADLLLKHGYAASGRTLILADPGEAWLLAMTGGRNFVAQRVPDDAVAVVANTYTIGEVDAEDRSRFVVSPGLAEIAQKQGWYDPEQGPFHFARAYSDPGARKSESNLQRRARGLSHVLGRPVAPDPDLPFAVPPARKLTLADVQALLRDHGDPKDPAGPDAHPHQRGRPTVCNGGTQMSSIMVLRRPSAGAGEDGAPASATGSVMWLALASPCGSPYLPIPLGVSRLPECLGDGSPTAAFAAHFQTGPGTFEPRPDQVFWALDALRRVGEDGWPEVQPPDWSELEASARKELALAQASGDPHELNGLVSTMADHTADLAGTLTEILESAGADR